MAASRLQCPHVQPGRIKGRSTLPGAPPQPAVAHTRAALSVPLSPSALAPPPSASPSASASGARHNAHLHSHLPCTAGGVPAPHQAHGLRSSRHSRGCTSGAPRAPQPGGGRWHPEAGSSPRCRALRHPDGREAGAPSEEESEELAIALAVAASNTKAGDVRVLDVRPIVYWTQYFVIATAFSGPQMDALAKRMSDLAETQYGRALRAGERKAPGPWTLMDYGDVVVHLFSPREREEYAIEGFYANARDVALPFLQEGSSKG